MRTMGQRGGQRPLLDLVAYASAPRTETDPSLAEQQAEIFDHVARIGGQVVETVIDGARNSPRSLPPGMRSMLSGLRLGAVDAVVATSLARMVRNRTDLFVVRATFTATRARLILTSDGVDTHAEGAHDELDRVMDLMAGDGLTRRVETERRRALSGDVKRTSTRVYGFDPTWTELVPSEAEVLRSCASRVLAGEPLRRVVDDLNRRGVPSPSAGGPWSAAGLRVLLVNPRIWGWRAYYGEPLAPGSWPAILDERTGERLIRLLSGRRQRHAGDDATALLDGLAHCASCGATMVVRRGSAHRYECPQPPVGCGGLGVAVSLIDRLVTEAVFDEITGGSRIDRLAAACRDEFADRGQASMRLAKIYRSRSDLARRISCQGIDPDDARAIAAHLDREKARVDRTLGYLRLARFTVEQRRDPRMIQSLHDLSASRRGSLVRLLLDDVIVSPSKRARGFDPGRVALMWRDVAAPLQDTGPLRSIAL